MYAWEAIQKSVDYILHGGVKYASMGSKISLSRLFPDMPANG